MQSMRICKHCLLAELESEQDFYSLVQSRIALLTEDEKATDEAYQSRLNACRACDQLLGGTCTQCGCYVELRAAKRGMHCPHINPKW